MRQRTDKPARHIITMNYQIVITGWSSSASVSGDWRGQRSHPRPPIFITNFMYYTKSQIEENIKMFKKRAETEPEFCQKLFDNSTIRLLSHKYAYYECNAAYLTDASYDSEEKGWYVMGRALGLLKEDETSPCIGFDYLHPFAERAIILSKCLQKSKCICSNHPYFMD